MSTEVSRDQRKAEDEPCQDKDALLAEIRDDLSSGSQPVGWDRICQEVQSETQHGGPWTKEKLMKIILAKLAKEITEKEKEIIEQKARNDGAFFSNLDELWDSQPTPVDLDWYSAIVRTPTQGQVLFPETVDDDHLVYAMAATTATSDRTNTTQRDTKVDLFGNPSSEKSHLVSNAPVCHKAYGHIAVAATGKEVGDSGTRLKLLNGVMHSGKRIRLSGLKHHKYNKFYLHMQGTYFDASPPVMMTIPLLDLEDVLGWNGTDKYNVMAITFGTRAPICQQQVLVKADQMSGTDEEIKAKVEQGRKLLEAFIKALASSILKHSVEESLGAAEGKAYRPLLQWRKLLVEMRNPKNPKQVYLPKERTNVDWSKVRVAVGTAQLDSSLPDPFLMAVKAAINCSSHYGMALLPACPLMSETSSSNGEVNTNQGKENERSGERDFSAVARSFQNPHRMLVEMFSSD